MKRYPFIKQEGIRDCGCACLLMIIKYYKGYIPLEQLRSLTKTTKYGTDAYHLIEAIKEIGFEAKALRTDLKKELILPGIVHVTKNGLGHYMVLYKINFKKRYLIIGDPASGIYKMNFQEFQNIWSGIFIELIPNRTIPINREMSFASFLVDYLKPYSKTLFILFLSSLLICLFSSISSFYFRGMIDSIHTSKHFLMQIFICFLIIHLFRISMDFLRNKIFIRFQQSLDMNMSCDIFNKIIDLPYQYYHNRTTGEIISRFDDLEYVRQMLQKLIFTFFSDLPLILLSFLILCFLNFSLAILVVAILIFYLLAFLFFKSCLGKYIHKLQEQNAMTTSFITESLTGIETINNCNLKEQSKDRFANNYYFLLKLGNKLSNLINIRYILTENIYQVGILIIILIGTIQVVDGNLSLGNLVMFYSVFYSFLEPLKNIINLDLNWKEAKNALKRMLSIFDVKKEKGIISYLNNPQLEFRNLSFYYNDIDCILKNINVKIKQGEKILFTGKSGSGKSTLLKLIMKYYEVSNQHLLIDNIDINYYKEDTIHQKIGYLSANEWLFTGSILNNLGAEDMNELLDVVSLCEIDKLMDKRSLNLNSIIEENGFNLSGGEKQRISLGRFLLRNFELLLIDEGLNQMDISLERRILKKMFEKYTSKTIIVVSHRLDNMDLFDRMIEVDKGKIRKDIIKNVS